MEYPESGGVLASRPMDPRQALADLTEISSQIRAAVIVDRAGSVLASTFEEGDRARRMAGAAQELLAAAEQVGGDERVLGQLQAATLEESVFLVRDGERMIVATTGQDPTVGLVFYDLKSALRSAAAESEEEAKPRPRARRVPKNEPAEGSALREGR
jgi:predicted regulator of Ras-like GTPase activity (Roadblock/LC7/MglB family)